MPLRSSPSTRTRHSSRAAVAATRSAVHAAQVAQTAGESSRAHELLRSAEGQLTTALVDEPAIAELYFWRARARQGLGAFAAADLDYATALARGFEDVLAVLLQRARIHRELGSFPRAEQDLADAIALAPHDVRAYEARSLLRYLRGDHEGAVADVTRAIHLAPDRPSGYYDRCAYLMALDRVDEALEDYQRGAALDGSLADESISA